MTTRETLRRAALPLLSVGIALVVLGPAVGRGFVLTYDMVFAPTQPLVPDSIGTGSQLPRSVPADAVIALLTKVLPGDLVQQAILLLLLAAGPLGAGRLVPTTSLGTRLVAATGYGWTAYVAERLFMGHWPYLVAYACLPWIAAAGLRVRRGEPKALAVLLLVCVPAALTPTGGLLAAGTALASAGPRRTGPVLVGLLVLNAPWWVPSVLRPGGALSTPDAVGAFAAREESWGGPVTSLLGLGGYWNSEVVPDSRALPMVAALGIVLAAIALAGQPMLARRWGVAPTRSLLLLGAFGVLLAAADSLPGGGAVLRWAVNTLPGAGLLRDAQKWVAWWALPLALGTALAVEWAAGRLRANAGRISLFAGAALFPILLLPDLAFGGFGRLATVDYPVDWARVRATLADDDRPGDVLTLPLGSFRRFAWNENRTQLDPAPRILPRTTLIDDTVHVGDRPIAGENSRLTEVRSALDDGPAALAAAGVGWLLVEHGTPGRLPAALAGLDRGYDGEWLTLYRVPGEVADPPDVGAPLAAVLVANTIVILMIAAGLLWVALPTGRFKRSSSRVNVEE